MARKKSSSRWGLIALVAAAAAIGVYVFVSASSNGEEQALQTVKVTQGDIEVTFVELSILRPLYEVLVEASLDHNRPPHRIGGTGLLHQPVFVLHGAILPNGSDKMGETRPMHCAQSGTGR